MPIFQYHCTSCDHSEEVLQKHADPAPACASCGKHALERVLAPAVFQLKGDGWFKDGYARALPSSKKRREDEGGE